MTVIMPTGEIYDESVRFEPTVHGRSVFDFKRWDDLCDSAKSIGQTLWPQQTLDGFDEPECVLEIDATRHMGRKIFNGDVKDLTWISDELLVLCGSVEAEGLDTLRIKAPAILLRNLTLSGISALELGGASLLMHDVGAHDLNVLSSVAHLHGQIHADFCYFDVLRLNTAKLKLLGCAAVEITAPTLELNGPILSKSDVSLDASFIRQKAVIETNGTLSYLAETVKVMGYSYARRTIHIASSNFESNGTLCSKGSVVIDAYESARNDGEIRAGSWFNLTSFGPVVNSGSIKSRNAEFVGGQFRNLGDVRIDESASILLRAADGVETQVVDGALYFKRDEPLSPELQRAEHMERDVAVRYAKRTEGSEAFREISERIDEPFRKAALEEIRKLKLKAYWTKQLYCDDPKEHFASFGTGSRFVADRLHVSDLHGGKVRSVRVDGGKLVLLGHANSYAEAHCICVLAEMHPPTKVVACNNCPELSGTSRGEEISAIKSVGTALFGGHATFNASYLGVIGGALWGKRLAFAPDTHVEVRGATAVIARVYASRSVMQSLGCAAIGRAHGLTSDRCQKISFSACWQADFEQENAESRRGLPSFVLTRHHPVLRPVRYEIFEIEEDHKFCEYEMRGVSKETPAFLLADSIDGDAHSINIGTPNSSPAGLKALQSSGYFSNGAVVSGDALVPLGTAKSPISVDLRKIFDNSGRLMHTRTIFTSSAPNLPTDHTLLWPLVRNIALESQCERLGDGAPTDQLECEQYKFLVALGMEIKRAIPVQFSYSVWKSLVEEFIWAQPTFHIVQILSKYTRGSDMFADFAQNAISDYKTIGAVPGTELTPLQEQRLLRPIVWPIWRQNCLSSNEPCISYQLYVPASHIEENLSDAVFGGRVIDIRVKDEIVIGANGRVQQLHTVVDSEVSDGDALVSISYESTQLMVGTSAAPTIKINTGGSFINVGTMSGRLHMQIGKTFANKGKIEAKDFAIIEAGNIEEDKSRYTLTGSGKPTSALLRIATNGDIAETATKKTITDASSYAFASNDIIQRTVQTSHRVRESGRRWWIERDEFEAWRNEEVITGKVHYQAGGTYKCIGCAVIARDGGTIFGQKGTHADAQTSYGTFRAWKMKRRWYGAKTQTWTEGSTHSTVPAEFLSHSNTPITLGTFASKTLFNLHAPAGIIIHGADGSAAIAHQVHSWMKSTTVRSGFLSGLAPKADLDHIRGIRNFKALKYGDVLGFTTGMISDVGAIANGVQTLGLLGAILAEVFQVGVTFGREITIISREGVTTVPTMIGRDGTGIFGLEIKGNFHAGHIIVNAEKITGFIAGNLIIKHGRDEQTVGVHRESSMCGITLSTAGLGITIGASTADAKSHEVTPLRSEFLAHTIMLAVNGALELNGAIINGKRAEIKAAAIEIKNALKLTTSESSSSSVGIGILIGWSGAVMPQLSVGMSDGFENSGLVEFLSEITGDDVRVIADKIAADLNQITANVQTKERTSSSGPKAFMDKQSSGFSLTVSKTPSISFFVEETDLSGTRRTSGTFSRDLIDGWLSPTQAPQEQTAPLDKKRKKPAPIKLLDEKTKSKLSDKQRKTLEPIVKDIETSLEDIKQTAQNKGLLHGKLKDLAEKSEKLQNWLQDNKDAIGALQGSLLASRVDLAKTSAGLVAVGAWIAVGSLVGQFEDWTKEKLAAAIAKLDPTVTANQAAAAAATIVLMARAGKTAREATVRGASMFSQHKQSPGANAPTPTKEPKAFFNEQNGKDGGSKLPTQSLKTPLKWHLDGPDPYQEALRGGKHGGLLSKYSSTSKKKLEKSIRSYEKQISLHREKIANPQKYLKHPERLGDTDIERYAKQYWPKEIRTYEEQRYVLQRLILEKDS